MNLTPNALAALYGISPPLWDTSVGEARLTGLSFDSRTTQSGELFLCLSSNPVHCYEALQRGAVICLVPLSLASEPFSLAVPNVLEAVIHLARCQRKNFKGKVWAVTGSSGKTTLKMWLHALLQHFSPSFHSPLSFNNSLGVAYSLALLPPEVTYGLFEIGTSAVGEILPLAHLVQPHVAVITLIGPAHLEFFGSLEVIALEKGAISQGLLPGGTLIIPQDDRFMPYVRSVTPQDCKLLTFGQHPQSDVRLAEVTQTSEGYKTTFIYKNTSYTSLFSSSEPAWLLNAASIIASCIAMGIPPESSVPLLGNFSKPSGRGKCWTLKGITVIDETYNANPSSFRFALESFLNHPCLGRRVAVVGDMGQLGPESLAWHASLNPLLAQCHHIYTYGSHFTIATEPLSQSILWHPMDTLSHLSSHLLNTLKPGDCVMIKGSRACQLQHVVTDLKQALSSESYESIIVS